MAQLVSIGSVLLQVSLLDSKCFVLQVLCDQRGVTIAIIDFCLCNDVCNL